MGLRRRKRPNKAAIIVVLWGLVFTVALMCHYVALTRQLEVLQADFLTQAQLDRLIADQRRISASGIFPRPSVQERDAGAVLNPYIKLDGGTPEHQTPVVSAWWSEREVYGQAKGPRGKKRAAPDQEPWLIAPETMPQGDLSVMTEIMAFDHWETSGPVGRYAEYLQTDEHPFLAGSPIPNLIDLQTLARLRLARGLSSPDGVDMLSALRETRQLARLTYSTEGLVASMVANALLSIEKRGYDRAVQLGLISADDWSPAEDSLRHAIRRVGFGSVMVVAGWTMPDDAMDQVAAEGLDLFNHCGALGEVTFQHHMLYPAWEGLPGERTLDQLGVRLQQQLEMAPHCRMPVARSVMADPGRMTHSEWARNFPLMVKNPDDTEASYGLMKVPYLRIHLLVDAAIERGAVRMFRQYGETVELDWQGMKR